MTPTYSHTFGAVDAALAAARNALAVAAAEIDADPFDENAEATQRALRVRAIVERAAYRDPGSGGTRSRRPHRSAWTPRTPHG